MKILLSIVICANPSQSSNDLMHASKLIRHETRIDIDANNDLTIVDLIGEFDPDFKHFERPVWKLFKNTEGSLLILGSQLKIYRLIRIKGQQLDVYSMAIPNHMSKQIKFAGESFDFVKEAEYGLAIE